MKDLIQPLYDRVRPYLPRRRGTYRGYVARQDRLLDLTTSRPDYKAGLVGAIEELAPGRDVCLAGFGRGVTSMIALEAGASSVTAYEGARDMIDVGIESFRLNDVPTDDLIVKHALVGEAIDLYGSPDGAAVVSPAALDPKDVLVLDCEGAEVSILDGLSTVPEHVIVETHPGKGADNETVRRLLEEMGMTVESRSYEPDNDRKRVLVGTRSRLVRDRILDEEPVATVRRMLPVSQ